jgi:hypothetical protein
MNIRFYNKLKVNPLKSLQRELKKIQVHNSENIGVNDHNSDIFGAELYYFD